MSLCHSINKLHQLVNGSVVGLTCGKMSVNHKFAGFISIHSEVSANFHPVSHRPPFPYRAAGPVVLAADAPVPQRARVELRPDAHRDGTRYRRPAQGGGVLPPRQKHLRPGRESEAFASDG